MQAFDAAVSGQGGLVMVVGEPGIGKTALCEQLATYVELRGGKALVGHCYEEGSLSLPYLAFVEAMRTYVLAHDPEACVRTSAPAPATWRASSRRCATRSQVELRMPRTRKTTAGVCSSSDVLSAQCSLRAAFGRRAGRPALGRPGTLDLLLHFARNLEGARLLIVGTYRDVEVDRTHPLSATLADLRRINTFLRVPLRGLTVDEVHRMYEAIRGQSVLWAQAELVYRQTEGNPLFVQEVLRYLVEEGVVYREGGRYQVREGDQASEAVIPEGLRDVVGRRLSRLDERANQVLSIASVVGREFRLDVLLDVANMQEEEVVKALEEAQERAIIEERPLAGSLGFRFTHALFRQTLYEEIFSARRIRWHQEVARALERIYSRRPEEHAAELAEHFANSVDRTDLEKAVAYGELAAKRAMSVFDYGEAARRIELAIKAQEVLDPDDAIRNCDLLLTLGEALLALGGARQRIGQEVAPRALAYAEQLDDHKRAWGACRLVIDANVGGQQPEDFTHWQEIAERHVGDNPEARVRLIRSKAGSAFQLQRAQEAAVLTREAIDLAKSLHDIENEFSAPFLGLATDVLGADERRLLEEYGSRDRAGVSNQTLSVFLYGCSAAYLRWGDRPRAEDLFRELEVLASQTRRASAVFGFQILESVFKMINGRLEDAVKVAKSVPQAFGANAGNPLILQIVGLLGDTRLAEEVPDSARPDPYPSSGEIAAHPLLSFCRGSSAAAEPLFKQLLAEFPAGLEDNLVEPTALLESAMGLRDHATVERFFSFIAGRSDSPWALGFVGRARLLGDAAVMLGRSEKARDHYEQAITACEAIAHRPELALTRAHLAELLLDHYPDEHDAAIEHLDFAIAEFREMKMQPALERALGRRGLLKA